MSPPSILTSPAVWAITAVHVSQSFGAYVLLTELPNYMKNVLHWDLKSKVMVVNIINYVQSVPQGIYSGLPFLAMTLVAMGSSVFVDGIIKRKLLGTTFIRKISNTVGTLGPGLALLGAGYSGDHPPVSMALLSLAMGCSGFIYSGEQSAMLDIANNFAGTLMGIINALG